MTNPLMNCLICSRRINRLDPAYNGCPDNCPFVNQPDALIDINEPADPTPSPLPEDIAPAIPTESGVDPAAPHVTIPTPTYPDSNTPL